MCGIGAVLVKKHGKKTRKAVRRLVPVLLEHLSERGTDAAGIAAYKKPDKAWIVKEPGHPVRFAEKLRRVKGWEEASVFLLHARATTSCDESNNYCNHPLVRVAGHKIISLVHNGVLDVPSAESPFGVDSSALIYKWSDDPELTIKSWSEITGSMAVLATDGYRLIAYKGLGSPLAKADLGNMIVYASTTDILLRALARASLYSQIRTYEVFGDGEYEVLDVGYD